ncbi:MAG TPA: hypothetical protein VKI44_26975 [Acetobacteraceae bacterium]|nr:hypothetical protein [Acetobacteraceae bacterium]
MQIRLVAPRLDGRSRPASAAFIVGFAILCFALALIFYWPGNVSADLLGVWLDARNAAITEPHGLLMSFIWRWLDMLLPGPQLPLAVQLSVYWCAIALLLLHFRPTRTTVIVSGLALSVNPFVLSFSGSLLVDVLSGNLALLGYMVLFKYSRSSTKTTTVVLSFCLFGLAGLARYQMWIVCPSALGGMLVSDRKDGTMAGHGSTRNIAIAFAAFLLVAGTVLTAIHETFDIRSDLFNSNLRYSMLYDIAAVIKASPDVSLRIFSDADVDVDMVRKRAIQKYTPYGHDPLNFGGRGSMYELVAKLSTDAIAQQWLDVASLAPGILLTSRIERFGIFLGFGRPYRCGPLDFLGLSRVPLEKWTALGKPNLREAYAFELLRSRVFPAGTILFRPITYLAVSLVLFAWLTWKQPDGAALVGSLIVSAWLYWLTFVPLPVSCDVRYSYFPCVATMFGLASCYLAVFRPKPRKAESRITPGVEEI